MNFKEELNKLDQREVLEAAIKEATRWCYYFGLREGGIHDQNRNDNCRRIVEEHVLARVKGWEFVDNLKYGKFISLESIKEKLG